MEGGRNVDSYQIILTIREYENSVEMPERERRTYVDPRGGVHLKAGDASAQKFYGLARLYSVYLRFGYEVDLATCGEMNPLNQLKVCDTPGLFLEAGFEPKPMMYTQRHLADAIHPKDVENYHWHGLSISQIKRLPSLLRDPVMLCDNPSRTDSILAVLAEVDGDKLPLIISIKPNGRGNYELREIETNIILTVFGKDNFERYFDAVITPDKVIYYTERQGRKLEALAERQLFRCHPVPHDLDGLIIRHPQCLGDISRQSAPPSTNQDMPIVGGLADLETGSNEP